MDGILIMTENTKKPKAKYKPRVKYTAKLGKFICEQIEDGLTLTEVCRKYKDKVPCRRTVLNMQKDNPEFKEAMDFAYYCFIQGKIDELEHISTASLTELYPDLEYKEAAEARRAKLDTLKFLTAKLAPALSTRWDKSTKVEHSGAIEGQNAGPQILIMNYSSEEQPAIAKGTTIDISEENQ